MPLAFELHSPPGKRLVGEHLRPSATSMPLHRLSVLRTALVLAPLACAAPPAAAQLHPWGAYEVRPYAHALVPPGGVSGLSRTGGGGGVEVTRIGRRGQAWLLDLSRSELTVRASGGDRHVGVWAAAAGVEQRWRRATSARWDLVASAGGSAGVAWHAASGGSHRGGPVGVLLAGTGLTDGRLGVLLRVQGVAADWAGLAPPSGSGGGLRLGLRVLGGVSLQL